MQLQPMYDYEFFGDANPLRLEEVPLGRFGSFWLLPFWRLLEFHEGHSRWGSYGHSGFVRYHSGPMLEVEESAE